MNQKAQAGLEYLMTYGWALIIIATVIGALVFITSTPTNNITFLSSDSAKIMLKGSSASGNTADLIMQNTTGGTINVSSVYFFGDLWPSADFKFNEQTSFPVEVAAGGEMYFNSLGVSINCEAGGTIIVNYTNVSGLEQKAKINCNGGAAIPVLYYKFDEDSDETAFDSSENGINGTLSPIGIGPTWQTTGCPSGNCLSFDRADDKVEIIGIPVDTTPGARNTVEFLMYWDGTSGKMPFGWNTSYDLWISNSCFGFNTGQGNIYGIPSAGLDNRWVNVRVIFYNGVPSSENNAIYIDGVKQNIYACSNNTTVSRTVTTTAYIGIWGLGGNYYFGGEIDEFKIYNQAIE